LNAVDRLLFDEIYHLGSRARAFLGNSCGIVFYRLRPTEIAKRGAGWGLDSIAPENVFIKYIQLFTDIQVIAARFFSCRNTRPSGGV
jgi:hypothetical protein